jgi:fumarate hydratase class II
MTDKQLWGGETAKAVDNFPISGETVPVPVVRWLARVKGAAAAVNGELGLLDKRRARSIEKAAAEIAAGKHDAQFPIDVFQTGSGTSTNMNANEVIAKLAGENVHANDHVNMGQSSNDVFPSAVHLAALDVAHNELLPALKQLERSFAKKAKSFSGVVKSGPRGVGPAGSGSVFVGICLHRSAPACRILTAMRPSSSRARSR